MSTAEKSKRQEQNQDLRCQSGPSAKDSVILSGGDYSKNYGADQQRFQISDLHFDKFPTPATFASWKIRFKTEVCICSQLPTEAMQWIKEVEIYGFLNPIIMQCDKEMSIIDVCRKVARERNARTVLRFSPKTSHQSNGFVEAGHGHIQGLARCCQTQIETNTGIQQSAISPAIPFAIRYAGFVLSRLTVRPDGRTPFPYLLGTPYVSPLCMFGESVFALIPDHKVRAAKLTNRWISGCWWGEDASSDEHLVVTKHGLLKCRSVRRKSPAEQWSRRETIEAQGTKWNFDVENGFWNTRTNSGTTSR